MNVQTSLESTPFVAADATAFKEFATTVVCRHHLARLPDQGLRERFIDELTAKAATDDPPFELDYWRLNIDAKRPPG